MENKEKHPGEKHTDSVLRIIDDCIDPDRSEHERQSDSFRQHVSDCMNALASGVEHGQITIEEAYFSLSKYCESESGTPYKRT